MPYFISPVAEEDIDETITYLAKENPKAAHDLIDALYDSGRSSGTIS